ncbi:helix-turn-helix transcriptional regulator [Acidovorax sp. SDU_ACID1]|uniref:helix-turn-helix transcriptional regulator n=1 Tax=Acidovorax sp. SDU_ACID1 TaxID=3136632 RepID=UPI0038732558
MKDIDVIRRENMRLIESEAGGTTEAATLCGMSPSQFANLRDGAKDSKTGKPRGMRKETARRIEECAKKPAGWLDTDHSVQPSGGASTRHVASAPHEAANPNGGEPDLVITEYSTGGAMGHGFALEENPPGLIRSWRVTHEWLRMNVPVYTSIENLCIVTGFGPSMKPRYNPGDPLLCDRGVRNVEVDGVYFFRVDGHGFIKQLQRIPTENGLVLRAKSFNKDYDPFDITRKMDFEVFGKILTAWRSEQF